MAILNNILISFNDYDDDMCSVGHGDLQHVLKNINCKLLGCKYLANQSSFPIMESRSY